VKVTVEGEPTAVVACHCIECQRRTGAVFGVGAYFPEERLMFEGKTSQYSRPTDSGESFIQHFCPGCGTTLFWRAGKFPGHVGIAVGAFADPSFPQPARSVWEQSRHSWIDLSAAGQHFPKGRQ
jgi:hypothetical protein